MDIGIPPTNFSLLYHSFPLENNTILKHFLPFTIASLNFQHSTFNFRPAQGILMPKGVRDMKLTGLAISLGVGAAAGAVTAMMLPKRSTTRKALQKAAYAVEDAAMNLGGKMANKMDM